MQSMTRRHWRISNDYAGMQACIGSDPQADDCACIPLCEIKVLLWSISTLCKLKLAMTAHSFHGCLQGRTTLVNFTDSNGDNLFRQDNSLNYTDIVIPSSAYFAAGFSGVSCVSVTFDNNCSTYAEYEPMTAYLVEVNRLVSSVINDNATYYSDPIRGLTANTHGFVKQSLCTGRCSSKHSQLDPAIAYYMMVGNADDVFSCTFQLTMTTYSNASGQAGMSRICKHAAR